MEQIYFDKQGRMAFHPEFHQRHSKHWTNHEQEFLIENYTALGPEEVSLALERTIQSVTTRVVHLRKKGLMPAEVKLKYHRRTIKRPKSS